MANTQTQIEVEDWVRKYWLPVEFGQQFRRERLRLSTGGLFDFDAVSTDNRIVASISTSGGRTSSGKLGAGKLHKLRADMLFLTMVEADRRLIILTEQDMYKVCEREKLNRRVPLEIDFYLANLPPELDAKLRVARDLAAREVQPNRSVE